MTRSMVLAVMAGCVAFAGTAQAQARMQALPPHHPSHAAPVSAAVDNGPMAGAAEGLARVYSGTPRDVLTYHYDNGRTGWNATETDLTPASVGSTKFGLLTTLAVDGNVFAQPLLVSRFVMPDGTTHDVLVVVTGHDSVYAYDAQSDAVLWHVSLGTPQSTNDVGCRDVQPEYGISSTPVILRNGSAATIYVVAATEPTKFNFHTQLHALDLGTGADVTPAVEIAPSATLSNGAKLSFDAQDQWSRTGLAAANGAIYVGIGSHCDANSGSISGWLLKYDPAVLGAQAAFHTIETPNGGTELASIWMTGFAPSLDAKGNLFVVTGNGDVSGKGQDWGESALSLNPALTKVRGRFTPASYQTLNGGDQDFGSGGIMLLPPVAGQTVSPLAVAVGKSAVLYLLDQDKLGGLKHGDAGALQAITLTKRDNAGLWGGPAYFGGNTGPTVFLQTDSDVLRGFSVATTGTPALSQTMSGTTQAGYGGTTPVVSSNGTAPGTGVVWVVRRSVPMELEAYDAEKLGAPIFVGHAGIWSNSNQNSFVAPMEANGRVYAPAYKTVKVFGLKP